MTKFSEFNDVEKDFLREIQMLTLQSKIKEESELTRILLRLLILGNGSGIVLLSTFMGVIAAYGSPVSALVYPLWMFFIGCILGASIYFPLARVAGSALKFHGEQSIKFIRDQIDIEDMQVWGLTSQQQKVIRILMIGSIIFFILGVFDCISILGKL